MDSRPLSGRQALPGAARRCQVLPWQAGLLLTSQARPIVNATQTGWASLIGCGWLVVASATAFAQSQAAPYRVDRWPDEIEIAQIVRASLQDETPAPSVPAAASVEDEADGLPPFAPWILGNSLVTNSMTFSDTGLFAAGTVEYLSPGRTNLSENNSAMPRDRVYFQYNHYDSAVELGPPVAGSGGGGLGFALPPGAVVGNNPGPPCATQSIDRYIVGIEKTFCHELASVDLRLPLFANASWFPLPGLEATNPGVGNLTASLKKVIWRNDATALSAGVGISTPTGSDSKLRLVTNEFMIHNDAPYLLPYVAFLTTPNDRWFAQGFLQLDLPLGGNRIGYRDLADPVGTEAALGKLDDQEFLYVDLSVGRWIYRDVRERAVQSLAAMVEFHYSTALDDSDHVVGFVSSPITLQLTDFDFSNARNRFDFVNLTFGLHAEVGDALSVRVAGVVPLSSGHNNFYDSEVLISVNRSF